MSTNESLTKEDLGIMFVCIQGVNVLGGIFACVPVKEEYLFELVAGFYDPFLVLDDPHVLTFDHLNLLLIDQYLVSFGFRLLKLLLLLLLSLFVLPSSPGFPSIPLVSSITVISPVPIPRSASVTFHMIC